MKLSYDRAEDILTNELAERAPIDHAQHAGQFIAHLTQDGRLVLLEILDANEFLASLVKVAVCGEAAELPSAV